MVLARQGDLTTLTLAMDYTGDTREFALLLPVPEVLTAEDVHVVDPALIQKVQLYASPRMVSYTCDDVTSSSSSMPLCGFSLGCGGSSMDNAYGLDYSGEPAENTVTVEGTFTAGDYEITLLSAEESSDLLNWLSQNGYQVPRRGQEILQEYIDAGVYFLAAKISLDSDPGAGVWLPPLQLTYRSEFFGLPIRIGTISSTGTQEVQIFAITDTADGEVRIANYPQIEMEKECMLREGADFEEYYSTLMDNTLQGQAGWVMEYSWDMAQTCDPCTLPAPFTPQEIEALGFLGADSGHYGYDLGHMTALRVRYTAEQATSDLSLYMSPFNEPVQQRYIQYQREMEQFFPICEEGWAEEPGTCFEEPACSAPGNMEAPIASLATVLGLLIWRRRR